MNLRHFLAAVAAMSATGLSEIAAAQEAARPVNAVTQQPVSPGFTPRLMPGAENQIVFFGGVLDAQTDAVVRYLQSLGLDVRMTESSELFRSIPSLPGNSRDYPRNFAINIFGENLWRHDIADLPFQRELGAVDDGRLFSGGDGGEAVFDPISRTLFVTHEDRGSVPRIDSGFAPCGTCLVELKEEGGTIHSYIVFTPDNRQDTPGTVESRAGRELAVEGKPQVQFPNHVAQEAWQHNARALYNAGVRQIGVLQPTTSFTYYDLDLVMNFLPNGRPIIQEGQLGKNEMDVIAAATNNREPFFLRSPPSLLLGFLGSDPVYEELWRAPAISPDGIITVITPKETGFSVNGVYYDYDELPDWVQKEGQQRMVAYNGRIMQTNFLPLPVLDEQGRQVIIYTDATPELLDQVRGDGFHPVTLAEIGALYGVPISPNVWGDGGVRCKTLIVRRDPTSQRPIVTAQADPQLTR